jgi:hypothetical protein
MAFPPLKRRAKFTRPLGWTNFEYTLFPNLLIHAFQGNINQQGITAPDDGFPIMAIMPIGNPLAG